MALTFTKTASGVAGDQRYWTGQVTFDSSYPTGGEAVTAADFEFIADINLVSVQASIAASDARWDAANSKILLTTGGATQASNASDQSAIVVTVYALGK